MISYQYVDGLEIRNNELLNKIEQLQARCAELEDERAEVALKAYRQGFRDSGEGFNGELYQDGFSKVVSVYNEMEAEYIESIKEQVL